MPRRYSPGSVICLWNDASPAASPPDSCSNSMTGARSRATDSGERRLQKAARAEMSTLDVTRSLLDTWECFNNQNSVDQLQPLWLTSSIKKYRGAPSINADRLAGPASTWCWPTSWMRSFRCGAAPPATASRGPTIDQETGKSDRMNGAGCRQTPPLRECAWRRYSRPCSSGRGLS